MNPSQNEMDETKTITYRKYVTMEQSFWTSILYAWEDRMIYMCLSVCLCWCFSFMSKQQDSEINCSFAWTIHQKKNEEENIWRFKHFMSTFGAINVQLMLSIMPSLEHGNWSKSLPMNNIYNENPIRNKTQHSTLPWTSVMLCVVVWSILHSVRLEWAGILFIQRSLKTPYAPYTLHIIQWNIYLSNAKIIKKLFE